MLRVDERTKISKPDEHGARDVLSEICNKLSIGDIEEFS
jgi:hypothetical protein